MSASANNKTHPLPASDRVGLNPSTQGDSPMVNDEKRWQQMVAKGRTLVTEINDRKWELGDLANEVCPASEHGVNNGNDARLATFADEIGLGARTLETYRQVALAFPEGTRVPSQTWTTHRMVAARDDRHEVIAEQTWTYNSLSDRLGRLPNPSRQREEPAAASNDAMVEAIRLNPEVAQAAANALNYADPAVKRSTFQRLSSDPEVVDDKHTRREAEKNLGAAFQRSDFGMKAAHAEEQQEATRKSVTDLRFIGATASLAVAKRKIREALAEVKGVAVNPEHAELLGADLDDLTGLVDLFRAFLAGDGQDVDWDSELAALMGGES